jgi:hypothetical protein
MRLMRHVVVAVTCGALLAGCGGSPEASPAPSETAEANEMPSSNPSATSSAGPESPVAPMSAEGSGRTSAKAFVKHYIDVLNYVTFGGDPLAARRLDTGECVSCDRMLEQIESIYRDGGKVEGGAWEPRIVGDVQRPGGWVVDVDISFGPQQVIRQRGRRAERYTGGKQLTSFILEETTSGWRVDAWTRAY